LVSLLFPKFFGTCDVAATAANTLIFRERVEGKSAEITLPPRQGRHGADYDLPAGARQGRRA
jgi:hypothetical protein